MNKWWVTAGLLIGGCALSLQAMAESGQGAAKARQEIEVMKSILNTSLARPSDSRRRSFSSDSVIEGFHLPGQGTTFLLQAPRIPGEFGFQLDQLDQQIRELTAREFVNPQFAESMARLAAANMMAIRKRLESEVRPEDWNPEFQEFQFHFPPPPPPPSPPPAASDPPSPPSAASPPPPETPPQPPAAPAPEPRLSAEQAVQVEKELRERMDRLRLSLEEVRERAHERKASAEQERQQLIDALLAVAAQYGDTMTHLGENEYLNFILLSGDRFLHPLGAGVTSEPEVISLKKSDITEVRRLGLGASGLRDRMVRP